MYKIRGRCALKSSETVYLRPAVKGNSAMYGVFYGTCAVASDILRYRTKDFSTHRPRVDTELVRPKGRYVNG